MPGFGGSPNMQAGCFHRYSPRWYILPSARFSAYFFAAKRLDFAPKVSTKKWREMAARCVLSKTSARSQNSPDYLALVTVPAAISCCRRGLMTPIVTVPS